MSELRRALDALLAVAADHSSRLRHRPVAPSADVAAIRRRLAATFDLGSPTSPDELVGEVVSLLEEENLHVTHPRYFGLFNPSVRPISVVADALVALYNPQLAAWKHAPAANEMERQVLAALTQRIGFDPASSVAHFTTGGQEANNSGLLGALGWRFPEWATAGARALDGQPTIYLSSEGHHSFLKLAHATGIGRDAVRLVNVRDDLRLDTAHLGELIEADRSAGKIPTMVVATAGTTGAGAIDELGAIANVAVAERMWLHVDAAWGGSALLSDELAPHLAGIERADSVTWDAHKWLSVPVGAGMFFSRHPQVIDAAFSVDARSYVPAGVAEARDPYVTSMQWSRRFIGLKLFMAIAELGMGGYGEQVAAQARIADQLRQLLRDRGWRIVNSTPLPLVCFTHPAIGGAGAGKMTALDVVEAVERTGTAWFSTVAIPMLSDRPDGGTAIRACITSYHTTHDDLRVSVDALDAAVDALGAA